MEEMIEMEEDDREIVIQILPDGFVAFCKVRQMKEVVRTFRGEMEAVPRLRLRY
jgi:hypothetical protein